MKITPQNGVRLSGNLDKERQEIIGEVNEKSAAKQGFTIQMGPTGLRHYPAIDSKPLTEEDFQALPEETRNEIIKKRESLDADRRTGFAGSVTWT